MRIKAGITAEVPELVSFLEEQTGDPVPESALYVGIYDDTGIWDEALRAECSNTLLACLIFYSPFVEGARKGVKFGGALAPGKTWGIGLSTFIELRDLIADIVFSGFVCDVLEADVRRCNERTARFLIAAGFTREIIDCRFNGVDTYRYEMHP